MDKHTIGFTPERDGRFKGRFEGELTEDGMRLLDDNLREVPTQRASVEYTGFAECSCECGGRVSTNRAASQMQIPGGVRFLGTPCDQCGRTYTVEMIKTER